MLDPFSPVKEEERQHVKTLLDSIHQQFIDAVKQGRGDRLKPQEKLFSGMFWTGKESVELGLSDALGDVDYVAREVIGAEETVNYTPQPDLFKRFADRLGAAFANVMSEKMGLQQSLGIQ